MAGDAGPRRPALPGTALGPRCGTHHARPVVIIPERYRAVSDLASIHRVGLGDRRLRVARVVEAA